MRSGNVSCLCTGACRRLGYCPNLQRPLRPFPPVPVIPPQRPWTRPATPVAPPHIVPRRPKTGWICPACGGFDLYRDGPPPPPPPGTYPKPSPDMGYLLCGGKRRARCKRPPGGWECSLRAGHDGPCPTRPRRIWEWLTT